jgi:hypothetical protein
MTNDRPDLPSERAPYRDKTATFGQKVISEWARYLDIVTD